jgi:hypothetical protein
MTLYPYETQLVVSADSSHVIMSDAVVTIYDPSDTAMATPLDLVDVAGIPLPNPVAVTSSGFLPAFQATVPQVMWFGGGYGGYMSSYKGLLDEAVAARNTASSASSSAAAAQSAAEAAEVSAAEAAVAPTDSSIDARLAVMGAPGKWKASKAYIAGQYLINPDGTLVKALVNHTSGSTYDPSKYTAGATGNTDSLPINVKDPAYGAVGDGVTDDTAAIQAALDAVPVGGRAVYLPAGIYKVTSSLNITQDGTKLYGDGSGYKTGGTTFAPGSRIQAASGVTGSVLKVQRAANDRPLACVTLTDFTIDGGNVGTSVDGILFRVNQGHIDRVSIWQCSGIGLHVLGYTSPVWETYDTIVTNCIIGQNLGAGVLLDAKTSDTHWSHCVFLNNLDNFIITGGASAQVTSCHFYTPERHDVWFNGSGTRSKFANCKFEGAKDDMVLIDSTNGGYSDIQFTGCGFSSLNQSIANNTFDYLKITGTSSNGIGRTTISGCNFGNKGGSSIKARSAINLDSSAAQNTVIVGNSFGPASHWGTTALINNSNSSLTQYIRGNLGVPDSIAPKTTSATAYTAAYLDADGTVETTASTAVTVTIPAVADAFWLKGTKLSFTQYGAGQITFAGASGVNLHSSRSLTTRAQYATAHLYMRGTNEWIVEGDLV